MGQKIVHLFVFDTLADWEPGYTVAGIGDAGFQLRPGCCRVRSNRKVLGLRTLMTPITA